MEDSHRLRLLHRCKNENGEHCGWMYWCPGCGNGHLFYTDTPSPQTGAQWHFYGTEDNPTFAPSMLIYDDMPGGRVTVCHSFVQNGQIIFLSDSRHELAGKTIPMQPF